MARIFVSHAREDRGVAGEIHRLLVEAGHEAFVDFDRRDGIQVGEGWEQRLYLELGKADAVVFVVSPSFVGSQWCGIEVAVAKSQGKRLVPLSIQPRVHHPLLADLHHHDYSADSWGAIAGVVQVLRGISAANSWPDGRSPFPGLQAFDVDWRQVFFGREHDIAVLAELLRSPSEQVTGQVVTVVGPSGCGKSSLVRAGLVPAMAKEPGWQVLEPVVPGVDPVGALARELAAAAVRLGWRAGWTLDTVHARLQDGDGLAGVADELLAAASGHIRCRRLLLVVDQFEETLTRASPERRGQFARLLAHAAVRSVAVVMTLRPEFLDPLSADPAMANLKIRPVLVRPLNAAGLAAVVVKPARVAGIGIDDALVRRMVADTGTGEALPLLAFALEQLAAGVRRGGSLSAERYDSIGGVAGALSIQADAALATARDFSGRSTGEVIAGLLRLVTVDEAGRPTRRRVAYADLSDLVRAELGMFVDRRLLTTDEVDGVVSVGVAHEAFLTAWSPLADAVAGAGVALRTRREVEHAATDWEAGGRPRRLLWGRGHLAAAVGNLGVRLRRPSHSGGSWLGRRVLVTERLDLGEAGRRFLLASIRRDRGLRRRAISVLSALLVVAVVAAVVATVNQNKAQEQQRVATARQLMAQARVTVDSDPKTALRLSLAARSIQPGDEAEVSVFETLTATRYLSTLTSSARSVAFSPDGRILAIGGHDGTVVLWDVADRARPQRLGQPLTGHIGWVSAVVFSPDGRTLATSDDRILLWDVSDRARPQRLGSPLTGPNGPVYSVVFSSDGRTLATGSGDGMVLLWDVSDRARPNRLGKPLTDHTSWVSAVAFSPDGHTLATSGNEVLLWDVSDRSRPKRLGQPLTDPGGAESMVFSSDGRTLTTSSRARTFLWDVADRAHPQQLGEPLTNPSGGVESAVLSPDGRTQAAGNDNGTVVLWDVADRARPQLLGPPLTSHTSEVVSIAYSPERRTLATGSRDGTVVLWDVADRARPQRLGPPLTGHTDWVESVAFSPDGHTLAAGVGGYGFDDKWKVLLWDVADRVRPQQLGPPLTDHIGGLVSSVAFSPDGRILATGGIDDTVLWDVSDRASPHQLGPPLTGYDGVESLVFSPDRRTLAIGSYDSTVVLWDVADRTRPQRLGPPLTGHTSNVRSVAFSPDGRTLATGSYDRTMLLWDVSDRTRPQRLGPPLTGHTSWVESVAFSPDGRTLATSSGNDTLLWDVSDRARPQQLGQPFTGSTSVVFAPDGHTLATGSGSGNGAFVVSAQAEATAAGGEQPVTGSGSTLLWSVEALLDLHAQSVKHACAYAGGGLDREEWGRYVPDLPYQDSCST